jgi:hypothetical protein
MKEESGQGKKRGIRRFRRFSQILREEEEKPDPRRNRAHWIESQSIFASKLAFQLIKGREDCGNGFVERGQVGMDG